MQNEFAGDNAVDATRNASPTRRWSMRLLAIGLSLAPLVVIELCLRQFATLPTVEAVDDSPLVDLHQLRPLFVLDETGERWQIPEERFNYFQPASFSARKPANGKRIFVLGGSTVQGRPYSTESSFSAWLKLRLEASCPALDYEVVNCGGVSYASYRVAKILDEVLQYEPDAIVIYTGHNEFLEDRTYADVKNMSTTRKAATRLGDHLHLVRWLRRLGSDRSARKESRSGAGPQQGTVMAEEVDAMLDHEGGLERYQRDASWKKDVEDHFAKTFRSMILRCKEAKVPLVVCVPVSDLVGTPPFKSVLATSIASDESQRFEREWKRAIDSEVDSAARLMAAEACLQLDSQHAGANYLAGRLAYELGQNEKALKHLIAARDHDVCPLRATTTIVNAVVDTSSEFDVPVVDVRGEFDRRNRNQLAIPDGLVDREMFLDHVHPTIAGHQRIATQISKTLMQLSWCDATGDAAQRYRSAATEHAKTFDETYRQEGRQRLQGLKQWAAGRAGKLGID